MIAGFSVIFLLDAIAVALDAVPVKTKVAQYDPCNGGTEGYDFERLFDLCWIKDSFFYEDVSE